MKRNLIALALMLALSQTFALSAHAEPQQSSSEPSRGTGLIAGGIVLTSLSAGAGIITAIVSESSCELKPCGERYRDQLIASGVLASGGIAGGIVMIVKGARMRHEWKNWKESQESQTDSATSKSRTNFDFTLVNRKPVLVLTHDF